MEVDEVQRKIHAGGDLLLVCAYDDDAKFSQYHLDKAVSLRDFKAAAYSPSALAAEQS